MLNAVDPICTIPLLFRFTPTGDGKMSMTPRGPRVGEGFSSGIPKGWRFEIVGLSSLPRASVLIWREKYIGDDGTRALYAEKETFFPPLTSPIVIEQDDRFGVDTPCTVDVHVLSNKALMTLP